MKNALVISGGGSKGAFAVGVVKYMADNRPQTGFDILLGTSTGSLIAPLVAIGELTEVEKTYTTVHTTDIITKGNLVDRFRFNSSLFDATPLANIVSAMWTQQRFDRLMASNKAVFVTTVCLQTGEITYWGNQDRPAGDLLTHKVTDRTEWIRAVLASANQPAFMQPMGIRTSDAVPRQYCDGGLREYLPMELAMALGATDIYAIALTPEQAEVKSRTFTSIFDILLTTMNWFSEDVGLNDVRIPSQFNAALRHIGMAKQRLLAAGVSQAVIDQCFDGGPADHFTGAVERNIHLLRPDAPLPGGPGGLDFIPANMMIMRDLGYAKAREYFTAPPPVDPFTIA